MDHKLCRICCENSGYLNIFSTDYITYGMTLSTKIMYCAKIKINETDGLPSQICHDCEEDLETAYRFVLKCETTDKKLRSLVSDSTENDNQLPKIEIKSEETEIDLNFSENEHLNYDSSELPKIEKKSEETEIDLNFSESEHLNYDSSDELKPTPLTPICQEIDKPVKQEHTKLRKKSTKHTKKFIKKRGPQTCSICGRDCINPSTLSIHMRSHTNEKPFQCEFCIKKYKDSHTLKRHVERSHLKIKKEKRFICENCGKAFFTSSEIITHLRTHTGETPFACSECPSTFTQLSSLLRHKHRHKGEKLEVCAECPKRFSTKEMLKRHQQVHINSKNFPCNICQSVFKYKQNLTKHQKQHSEPDSFVCNHCGRTFNTKGNLTMHTRRIHSEKSGHCETCSKVVSNIEVHMRKHTGELPIKCELCTRCFSDQKALSLHMMYRHKQNNKYKCEIENCFQSFPFKTMLDYHVLKIHDNRFTFPCDKCPRGFFRKNDLSRHMIGTHKQKL